MRQAGRPSACASRGGGALSALLAGLPWLLLPCAAAAVQAQDQGEPLEPPPVRSSLDGPWEDEDDLELLLPVEQLEDGTVIVSGPDGVHHLPPGRWSGERCAAALDGQDLEARRRAVFEAAVLSEDEAAHLVERLVMRLQDPAEEALVRQVAVQVLGRLGPRAGAATPALLGAVEDELLGLDASLALARVITAAELPALAEGLRAEGSLVRGAAAAALARLLRGRLDRQAAAPLVDPLAACVDDDGEDPELRRLAAWSLGRLGSVARAALPRLIGALRDEDVAGEAMVALVRLELPETVPALVGVLGEPASEPTARRHCAQLLALVGRRAPAAREAREALLRALGDAAPEVRVEALRAAHSLGLWEQVLPRLPALIEDADEEVVFTAVTLACQRDERWPDEVLPALARAFPRWPAESARRALLLALTRCGPQAAGTTLPLFRQALTEGAGGEAFTDASSAADEALRGLAGLGPLAAPALEEVLAHLHARLLDPGSAGWEALAAVGSAAAPGVATLLAHEDRRVRARAAEVLAAGGPAAAAALEPLRAAREDELYPEVQAALDLAARSLQGQLPPAEALAAVRQELRGPQRPPAPLSPLGAGPARASGRVRAEGPRCFEVRLDARGPHTEGLVRDWDGLLSQLRAAAREPDLERHRAAEERAWVNHLAPELRTRAALCDRALRRLLSTDLAGLRELLGEAPHTGDLVLARGPDELGDERETVLILGERLGPDGAPAPRLIAPEAQQQVGEVWLPGYLSYPLVVPRLDHYPDHVGWLAVDTAWALERVAPDGSLLLDQHQGLRLRLTSEDLERLRAGGVRLYTRAGGWGAHCLRAAGIDRSGPLPP